MRIRRDAPSEALEQGLGPIRVQEELAANSLWFLLLKFLYLGKQVKQVPRGVWES